MIVRQRTFIDVYIRLQRIYIRLHQTYVYCKLVYDYISGTTHYLNINILKIFLKLPNPKILDNFQGIYINLEHHLSFRSINIYSRFLYIMDALFNIIKHCLFFHYETTKNAYVDKIRDPLFIFDVFKENTMNQV